MEETGFELTGTTGRCGDVKGFLTTGNDNFVTKRRNWSRIDGTFRFESFKDGQGGSVNNFSGIVTGSSDEIRTIRRQL